LWRKIVRNSFNESDGISNTLGNNKILIGVIIALLLIVAVIGTYAVVTTLNNDNNDSDSAVDNSVDTSNSSSLSASNSPAPETEFTGRNYDSSELKKEGEYYYYYDYYNLKYSDLVTIHKYKGDPSSSSSEYISSEIVVESKDKKI